MDSHTGVFLEPKWRWLGSLHGFLARRASISIVTNDYLGGILESWHGRYFVFPDVPTEFPDAEVIPERPEDFVVVVNSFSYDEPLNQVIAAARELPSVSFAVTGDVRRCPPEILKNVPNNVRFTGFVSPPEYVRGAYEAMSLGVPIVTSNWPLLKETFFKGTCHTDNTSECIAAALRDILANKALFRAEIADLKRQRRKIWTEKLALFSDEYPHL
jgi:glycosyltransferase involved in cell wall biosynthesis